MKSYVPHLVSTLNLYFLFKGVTIDRFSLDYRKYRSNTAQNERDFFGELIIQP